MINCCARSPISILLLRFEIGRYEAGSLGSSVCFFSSGRTIAYLLPSGSFISSNQLISMHFLCHTTSKSLRRQNYSENTTAFQCHNNDSAKRWVFSLVKKRVYVDEVQMCDGRRFQAYGTAAEKELLESWRLNRGTMKSPRDVERSWVSEHGWQSSVKYVGADPWTTRYINEQRLCEILASLGNRCICPSNCGDGVRDGAFRTARAARFWTR